MKKVNVRNLVFGVMMALMLIAAIAIYTNNSTANAVEETSMEEVERTWWICGDDVTAEIEAKRFVNEIHTNQRWREVWYIGLTDYNDEWEVIYYDDFTEMLYGVYFGE